MDQGSLGPQRPAHHPGLTHGRRPCQAVTRYQAAMADQISRRHVARKRISRPSSATITGESPFYSRGSSTLYGGKHMSSARIRTIAAMIPAWQAQIAVAKIMAALGCQVDAHDTLDDVNAAIRPVMSSLGDIPSVFEESEAAVRFWESVNG